MADLDEWIELMKWHYEQQASTFVQDILKVAQTRPDILEVDDAFGLFDYFSTDFFRDRDLSLAQADAALAMARRMHRQRGSNASQDQQAT